MKPTREDLSDLRTAIGEGKVEVEAIAEATGWDYPKIVSVVEALYAEEEANLCGRRAESVYVEYVVRSRANIALLDKAIRDDKVTGTALVGAIKAKQGIADSVIRHGVDLRLIKATDSGGVDLGNMTRDELAMTLIDEVRNVRAMMSRHGDEHFLTALPGGKASKDPGARGSVPTRKKV